MNKAQKRRVKALQGYVKSPPRCVNCSNYTPPTQAAPATIYRPALHYEPPRCQAGGFAVEPHSICDDWRQDQPSMTSDRETGSPAA
jgi:hypothetical protein